MISAGWDSNVKIWMACEREHYLKSWDKRFPTIQNHDEKDKKKGFVTHKISNDDDDDDDFLFPKMPLDLNTDSLPRTHRRRLASEISTVSTT